MCMEVGAKRLMKRTLSPADQGEKCGRLRGRTEKEASSVTQLMASPALFCRLVAELGKRGIIIPHGRHTETLLGER